jgi:hypothetical protein
MLRDHDNSTLKKIDHYEIRYTKLMYGRIYLIYLMNLDHRIMSIEF